LLIEIWHVPPALVVQRRFPVAPEVLERLRSLGYLAH